MNRVLVFAVLFGLALAGEARAHEVRPAYLQITESAPGRYSTFWKVPQVGQLVLGIHPRFPPSCRDLAAPRRESTGDAAIERRVLDCGPQGLAGKRIEIENLRTTVSDVLVRIEALDGSEQTSLVSPDVAALDVEARPSGLDVMRSYWALGVKHILTGIDHLLFILALIVITGGGWKLAKTVTAFTISHSVTLTAAALGFVHVPPAPVEAVIALSIVFVASEIVQNRRGRETLTARAPWLVAFTFGLLHGLGFAGGLSEIGLPSGHIPLALLCFNCGVETGHFLFVGVVSAIGMGLRRVPKLLVLWQPRLAAYAIGMVASYWLVARVVAFW